MDLNAADSIFGYTVHSKELILCINPLVSHLTFYILKLLPELTYRELNTAQKP